MAKPKSDRLVRQQQQQGNSPSAQLIQHHQLEFITGPLPPPSLLAKYEEVYPGTAERILKRFEKEAEHRHEMERTLVNAQIQVDRDQASEARRGQNIGAIIAIVGLGISGMVIVVGATTAAATAGAALGGSTLVALVTAFIVGRSTSSKKEAEPRSPEKPSTEVTKTSE